MKLVQNPERISTCCVDIVGLPPCMLHVAQILVRHGCNLRLVDKGYVSKKGLSHSVLITKKHIGEPKALVLKKELKRINQTPIVKGFHEEITTSTKYLLSSDVVINATFNKDVVRLCPEKTLHIDKDLTVSHGSITYTEQEDVDIEKYFSAIGNIIQEVYRVL